MFMKPPTPKTDKAGRYTYINIMTNIKYNLSRCDTRTVMR